MSKYLQLFQVCNTLDRQLASLWAGCDLFLDKQDEYTEKRLMLVKEGDRGELDQFDSILQEHETKRRVYVNIHELNELLCKNPFPGEQKRILTIAHELLPDATLCGYTGKAAWQHAFRYIGMDDRVRVYFPTHDDPVALEPIEERLYATMDADGYIPASSLVNILGTDARTQLYKDTKQSLLDRGWAWQKIRIDGTMTATILPPESLCDSRYG